MESATPTVPETAQKPAKRRCRAKSKQSQQPCRKPPMRNGLCSTHGGKSLTGPALPQYKTGKHSKYQYLPESYTARIEELTTDVLQNLEESIKIQQGLEMSLLERIDTGESPKAWDRLRSVLDDPDLDAGSQLAAIRRITEGALEQYSLTTKIQSIHDTQRKLTETLSKVRKETQETYTQEQWNQMMNMLLNAARTAITDRPTLQKLIRELDAYRRIDPEQPKLLAARTR